MAKTDTESAKITNIDSTTVSAAVLGDMFGVSDRRIRQMAEEGIVARAAKGRNKQDVEIVMTDMLVAFKTRMMNIPSKVAPILESRDAVFIKDRLTCEIIEALNELKDYDPRAFYSEEYVEEDESGDEQEDQK